MHARRWIGLVAVLAAATLTATACGGSDNGAGDDGGVTKLTFWTGFTGGDRAAYEHLVRQFNATHPKIQVTMDVQPWDTIGQKLPSAWATGKGPDLATPSFNPSVVFQYVKTGSAAPLDALYGAGGTTTLPKDAIPQSIRDAFTVDGKIYAAPANVATLQLYYNKKLLPQPPKTAEELQAAARKASGHGRYGIALADHETIQMWPILLWMNGGDIVDAKGCARIADPASVSALKTWNDLVTKDKVSPIGLSGADADTLFSAGKAAMEMNGPWAAASFEKAGVDFGLAPIPAGAGGPVTLASTVPIMVSRRSPRQKAAFEFLAWWAGKQAQAQFAKDSGFPPIRTDMANDPALAANERVRGFAAALPNARLYLPGLEAFAEVDDDVFVPLIGKINRGADVQKAATDAAKAIDQLTGCKA
jgi:multiple sugar transport system substrate-binding protein